LVTQEKKKKKGPEKGRGKGGGLQADHQSNFIGASAPVGEGGEGGKKRGGEGKMRKGKRRMVAHSTARKEKKLRTAIIEGRGKEKEVEKKRKMGGRRKGEDLYLSWLVLLLCAAL